VGSNSARVYRLERRRPPGLAHLSDAQLAARTLDLLERVREWEPELWAEMAPVFAKLEGIDASPGPVAIWPELSATLERQAAARRERGGCRAIGGTASEG
jgi:hypothetical protein